MLTTVQTPKTSRDLAPTLEKTISQHPPLVLYEVGDEGRSIPNSISEGSGAEGYLPDIGSRMVNRGMPSTEGDVLGGRT